jgi:Protein of unknown function (DUF3105)
VAARGISDRALELGSAAALADDKSIMRGRLLTVGDGRSAVLPVLCALVALVAVAPVGLALSDDRSRPTPAEASLRDVARQAECRLSEYDHDPRSNPPVSGRVDERITAHDGSYVARRAPSALAATHALLHGRVIVQYRPDLPAAEVRRLDRLVRRDPAGALLFANRTGMPEPVAATAYLTLMTCPRVDAATIGALRAFRARRGNFGQGF